MSKGREFNDILDECLERLLSGGDTVEQCLEGHPEYAAELEPLLRTAVAARAALAIKPNEEFRARARYQLRSEMDRAAVKGWRPILNWQPRWAVAIVVVLAVVLAGGSTVLAADSSMPGSPLYPVKLATENVRLTLSSSDVTRAELSAVLANRRIAEIAYAIKRGKLKQVERVTERLNSHLVTIARLSLAASTAEAAAEEAVPAPSREEAVRGKPEGGTAPQRQAEKVAPEQKSAAAARPSVAAEDREGLSARAVPEASAGVTQRARLRVLLGQYAVNHPAKLRALLEEAPEAARPALLKVIAASVASYRQALEELNRQSGDSPAKGDTDSEQSSDSPANSDTRPEQSGDSPANSDTRPEQSGDSPAKRDTGSEQSGDSPAKRDTGSERSSDSPAKSDTRR